MALNFADRDTLRPALVPRLRQVVEGFLLYTANGGGSPSTARLAWCQTNLSNVNDLAEKLSHWCMTETAFIDGGTSITDEQLKSRGEYVLANTPSVFMPA